MARREVRTPVETGAIVELGNGMYRKQVLPHTTIDYQGRPITFDRAYCDDVAEAFRSQAFDTVPFVLADADNSHTMAAERGAFGEVLGMESTDDGLYATFRLSQPAQQIVESNPRFGVSVRVKEDYARPDGKAWKRACQHVLGTWDPKLTGMSPWEPVDLSADPEAELIDLTNSEEKGADMTAPNTTETDPDSGPDQTEAFAAFQRWMAAGQPDPGTGDETEGGDEQPEDGGQDDGESGDDTGETGEFDVDGMSDDEFSAFLDEIVADEPAEVAASNTGDAVELSNGQDPRVVELSQANATLQRRLDASDYEREADEIVRRTGLPPHVVDLARDVLEGTGHVVELSNDAQLTDRERAGQVVRNVFEEIGQMVKLLDLSEPQLAHLQPVTDEATEQAERRSDNAKRFLSNAGL